MRRILVLFVLILAVSGHAFAQEVTQASDPTHCFVSHPSLLREGDVALANGKVNMRSEPSIDSEVVQKFDEGTEFHVVEDPTCTATESEGWVWVKVTVGDTEGYVGEIGGGEYNLVPKGTHKVPYVAPFEDPMKYPDGPLYYGSDASASDTCEDALVSWFEQNQTVSLAEGIDYNTLRVDPRGDFVMSGTDKVRLLPGQTVQLIEGPVCRESKEPGFMIPWWKIQLPDGTSGWIPERQYRRNDGGDLRPEMLLQIAGHG